MAALQYVDVPGYSAILFRKTLTDLKQPGALLDRSMSWLVGTDAKWEASTHTWSFPTYDVFGEPATPSKITFGYIGESQAHLRYLGIEVQYCVAPWTKVLMGDGSHRRIDQVRVGDLVQTLSGVRKVTRTHRVKKPAVKVVFRDSAGKVVGEQVQGTTHRLWTGFSSRLDAGRPKESGFSSISEWQSFEQFRVRRAGLANPYRGLRRTPKLFDESQAYRTMASSVCPTGGQTDCEVFDGGLPESSPLLGLSFPVTLLEPGLVEGPLVAPRSGTVFGDPLDEQPSDFLDGYSSCRGRDGVLGVAVVSHQKHPRLLVGVDKPNRSYCFEDATERTPRRSRTGLVEYTHPYTNRVFRSSWETSDGCEVAVPVCGSMDALAFVEACYDSLEMCDLTVEEVSHYITSSNEKQYIVQSNCAYDEVTQHTEEDYRYLFSRLRKLACPIHKTEGGKTNYRDDCPLCQQQKNLPIRMRCATNPGGPGSSWVKRRFKIGPHIDLRKAALTGEKVRYVGHEDKRPFIPSFAADNPYLDLESYASQLDELDPTTREELKEGRWDVSPDSRFKRHWAKYYSKRGEYFCLGTEGTGPQHHADSLTRIFCTVDPASSSKHGPGDILTWKKEPSYTVISVWGLTRDYHLLWLDMVPENLRNLNTIQAFLLKHGTNFEVVKTQKYGLMEPQHCYFNCFRLAKQHNLIYCEGYARLDRIEMPILHAWCTTPNNLKVIEPTNRKFVEYFGVSFQIAHVKKHWQGSKVATVLDDWQRDWPTLNATPEELRNILYERKRNDN